MLLETEAVHPAPDDMEIAPGYTVGDWKALALGDASSPDWQRAIDIFETRIRRRFIEPVDVLIAHEIGLERGAFGFAILAIDCLLIESLQGFREGVTDHTGKSGALIRKFLAERAEFKALFSSEQIAGDFYKHYRCALLHSGQTDGDFRVRRSGQMIQFVEGKGVDLNRTAFHEAVKRELDRYLDELRAGSDTNLRNSFRMKMDAVCGIPAAKNGKES